MLNAETEPCIKELLSIAADKKAGVLLVINDPADGSIIAYASKAQPSPQISMLIELVSDLPKYERLLHGLLIGRITVVDPEFAPKITAH